MLCAARLRPGAVLPVRSTEGAVGYDLCVDADHPPILLEPGQQVMVPTGLILWVDHPDFYPQIIGRSGIAKKGVAVMMGGVIDPDYRGEVFVMMRNLSNEPYLVEGRIAQVILLHCAKLPVREVAVSDLSTTQRGEGGFGSTGTRPLTPKKTMMFISSH